ncbi:MAG: phosphopantetheine-binding protein [Paucimonas sp.]|jgi:acyl carrier protein|nr:phosphopantetheine-binding protein [Paucimonas sp.]
MINDQVLDIIVAHLRLDERPKLQDKLLALDADSMDLLEMREGLKETFGIELPDDITQADLTVAQLIKLVSDKLK